MADFGTIKAQARQVVHDSLSVSALYSFGDLPAVAVGVTHRDRLAKHGDLDGDYASVLEGVDRLKFNLPQLLSLGLVPKRGGRVVIPSDDYAVYELDQKEPSNGPVNVYWQVVNITKEPAGVETFERLTEAGAFRTLQETDDVRATEDSL